MLNPFDAMPTIKAILGMTMAQDIAESVLLAQLDDFEAPRCESNAHASLPECHSGAAGFLIVTPCHCFDGYRCKPFIDWLLTRSNIYCVRCDSHYDPCDITAIPIGGAK